MESKTQTSIAIKRTAALLLSIACSGCGTPIGYHIKHYKSPFTEVARSNKTYFHSQQTGRIIEKDPCTTYREPGCFGYEPTVWTRWPSECAGACPVQGEVLTEEMIPVASPEYAAPNEMIVEQPMPESVLDSQPEPAAPIPETPDPIQTIDELNLPTEPDVPSIPTDAESAVPSPSDSGSVAPVRSLLSQPTMPLPVQSDVAEIFQPLPESGRVTPVRNQNLLPALPAREEVVESKQPEPSLPVKRSLPELATSEEIGDLPESVTVKKIVPPSNRSPARIRSVAPAIVKNEFHRELPSSRKSGSIVAKQSATPKPLARTEAPGPVDSVKPTKIAVTEKPAAPAKVMAPVKKASPEKIVKLDDIKVRDTTVLPKVAKDNKQPAAAAPAEKQEAIAVDSQPKRDTLKLTIDAGKPSIVRLRDLATDEFPLPPSTSESGNEESRPRIRVSVPTAPKIVRIDSLNTKSGQVSIKPPKNNTPSAANSSIVFRTPAAKKPNTKPTVGKVSKATSPAAAKPLNFKKTEVSNIEVAAAKPRKPDSKSTVKSAPAFKIVTGSVPAIIVPSKQVSSRKIVGSTSTTIPPKPAIKAPKAEKVAGPTLQLSSPAASTLKFSNGGAKRPVRISTASGQSTTLRFR